MKLKEGILALMTAAIALVFASMNAHAAQISGGISLSGNLTAYVSSNGIGTTASDYTKAHGVVFGPSSVNLGASGTFAGIASGTPASLYSPLVISPPQLPVPQSSPLWQVTKNSTTY